MSRVVAVEQMLIGWSRTSNGKNVLARSPGWPTDASRGDWVSSLGDFLHPEVDRVVRRTGDVPWLLEFLPHEHGSILMAKTYAAESQRAGEFQVHALLDPTRTLGPQHLPGLADAGVLLRERPPDVTWLDTLTVTIPRVPASRSVPAVALALAFLHGDDAMLVRADTLEESVEVLGELAAALPASVAVRTPARSVITGTADARGIAIVVEPWTQDAESAPALEDAPIDDAYRALAKRVVAGEWALPDESRDMAAWLDLAVFDPRTATADAVVQGVTGPLGERWLEQALATARTRDLLLNEVRTGRVPWGDWTDDLWLGWLTSNRKLSKGLRATVDAQDFVEEFAHLLDRLPRTALDQAMSQLSRWPEECLDVLAETLLRCDNASPDLLIQTLDRLPDDEVRRIVQRHWPGLGRQLGLPVSVIQALKPTRSWFGR